MGQIGKAWELLLAVVGFGQVGSMPFTVQVFVQSFETNQGGVINDENLSLLQIPKRPIAELPHSENGQVLDDPATHTFGKPRMVEVSQVGIQSVQPCSSDQRSAASEQLDGIVFGKHISQIDENGDRWQHFI